MSLLTTWTSTNRVRDTLLQSIYNTEFLGTGGGGAMPGMGARQNQGKRYCFTRIRTKQYRYVGLTAAAAASCRDAMIEKYTRTYPIWRYVNGIYRNDGGSYPVCVADVGARRTGGNMWEVAISVDETCLLYCVGTPYTTAQLHANFDTAFGVWDYDED